MTDTREHFNLSLDELLQVNSDGYTKEEAKLFDAGEKVSFFNNVSEWENEKLDYMLWLDSRGLHITGEFETINGRIAVVSNY